jgi:hypothetical protein
VIERSWLMAAKKPSDWRELREWAELKELFDHAARGGYVLRYHRLGRFVTMLGRCKQYGDNYIATIATELGLSVSTICSIRKFYQMYPSDADARRFRKAKWPWRALTALTHIEDAKIRRRLIRAWERGDYTSSTAFIAVVREYNGVVVRRDHRGCSPARRLWLAATKLRKAFDEIDVAILAMKSAKLTRRSATYKSDSDVLISEVERRLAGLRKKATKKGRRTRSYVNVSVRAEVAAG